MMKGKSCQPPQTMVKSRAQIQEVVDFQRNFISPLQEKWLIIRWIYTVKRKNKHPAMSNFDSGEFYLEKDSVLVTGSMVKLSNRDAFMFGFLIEYGFRLHYKCISDEFKGKDNGYYQVGLMAVRIFNTMFCSDFQVLLEKRGYRYTLMDAFPW